MSPDAPQGPQYPRYPGEQQPESSPVPAPAAPTSGAGTAPVPSAAQAFPTSQDVHRHPPTALPDEPAGWWIRVVAAVVDFLVPLAIVVVPFVGGLVLAFADADYVEATDTFSNTNPWGFVVAGLAWVVFIGFDLWNRGLRVGYRGQSLGKQLVGVHVLGRDGGVVGPLEGFFRWLLASLLQWTFVGLLVDLLWPLWDARKQTVHDKAINTFPVRR